MPLLTPFSTYSTSPPSSFSDTAFSASQDLAVRAGISEDPALITRAQITNSVTVGHPLTLTHTSAEPRADVSAVAEPIERTVVKPECFADAAADEESDAPADGPSIFSPNSSAVSLADVGPIAVAFLAAFLDANSDTDARTVADANAAAHAAADIRTVQTRDCIDVHSSPERGMERERLRRV